MAMTLGAIVLPDDLIWVNEFESQVVQSKKYTLSGALVVRSNIKNKGRLITLQGDQVSGWIKRDIVKLLEIELLSLSVMVLTLHDGRTFNVMLDATVQPIIAEPIIDYNHPDDNDMYQLTLNLFEV